MNPVIFVALTQADSGESLWLDINRIEAIAQLEGSTLIVARSGESYLVRETPDGVWDALGRVYEQEAA